MQVSMTPRVRERGVRATRRGLLAAAALAVATLTGCAKSCKDDHPYVPYAVGDVPSSQPSAVASTSSMSSPEPTGEEDVGAAEPAVLAPPGATTWHVSGMALFAPEGKELVSAIVRDFDGDGANDAVALVRAAGVEEREREGGAPAASVLFYAGVSGREATVSTLVSVPERRATGPVTPILRLARIGPRSAFAEIGYASPRGAGERSLFVLRLTGKRGVSFDLGVLDPPGAPRLVVDFDAADRDRDGLDDVTLRVSIEGGAAPFEPGPKLSAKIAFYDRPAGPSRDAEEPEASLRAVAAQAAARAAKPKDAPTVPALVQQMRALFRAICVEGGAPRLVKRDGGKTGAVSCGSSKPLEDAAVAEIRAHVTRGDALRAIAAADIAQVPPATKTAARTKEITSLLEQVAPVVTPAVRAHALLVSATRARQPEWGALGFEPSGALLARTVAGVLRVDPDSGEGGDAQLPAWGAQVVSPDGKSRWLEAYHACEGVSLRSTFVPIGDGEMREVLLPIAPPLGTRCAGTRGEAAQAMPIAWTDRGLEALVAGQPLLIRPEVATAVPLGSPTGGMPPLGSPRSPGGTALAVATSAGVLVIAPSRVVRVRAAELEPYADLRHCTTTDDGLRVACAKRGRVMTVRLAPP